MLPDSTRGASGFANADDETEEHVARLAPAEQDADHERRVHVPHAWTEERIRLGGLESVLDEGTRRICNTSGSGRDAVQWNQPRVAARVALWLAEAVAPDGKVIATDLETDFLQAEAAGFPTLEVLQHDITTEELPTGFDLVRARWLTEWLPDKRRALRQDGCALRPRRAARQPTCHVERPAACARTLQAMALDDLPSTAVARLLDDVTQRLVRRGKAYVRESHRHTSCA